MIKTNFETTIGDDFAKTVTILDADSAAEDVTGWTLFLTIKTNPDDTDANAIFKDEYSPSVAASGQFIATISAAVSALIALGIYHYDMQVKKNDGTIVTILKGVFTFNQETTIRTA